MSPLLIPWDLLFLYWTGREGNSSLRETYMKFRANLEFFLRLKKSTCSLVFSLPDDGSMLSRNILEIM